MGTLRAPAPPHTRRQLPRYEIAGAFHLRDRTVETVVDLVDVSLGGFCTTSRVSPSPGALHEFEVAVAPTAVLVLQAREVYTYPIEGETDRYVVGWTWAHMPLNADGIPTAVAALLEYLASTNSGIRLTEQPPDASADGS